MANKKLKVEVELETAKAKRQAKELEQSGGASAGGAGGIASTSKKLRELGDSANKASINMRSAAKAMTGIAVGLAGSYAAGHMKEGSTGRVALEYGSSAVSGASMGAMIAGPIGAAIGGLAGTLKTYLDRSAANQGAIADYQKGEETYAKTREWSKHVKSITGIGEIKDYDFIKNDGERLAAEMKDVAEHLEKTKFHIKVLNNAIPNVQASIKRMQEAGDTDTEEYKKLIEELQEHRSKLAALESAEDSLAKQEHNLKVEEGRMSDKVNDRPGFSAPDSLSRIGGAFAGQSRDWPHYTADVAFVRNRQQKRPIENVTETMDTLSGKKSPGGERHDISIADAFSRIEGTFARQQNDPEARTQTATMKEQLEVLKRIEQKSGGKF